MSITIFLNPTISLYKYNSINNHVRLLVVQYGLKKQEEIEIPLKVYYWYSAYNGYISGFDIAPKKNGTGDYYQEKGLEPSDTDTFTTKVIKAALVGIPWPF